MKKAALETLFLFFATVVLAQFDDVYLAMLRLSVLALGSVVIAIPLVKTAAIEAYRENSTPASKMRSA